MVALAVHEAHRARTDMEEVMDVVEVVIGVDMEEGEAADMADLLHHLLATGGEARGCLVATTADAADVIEVDALTRRRSRLQLITIRQWQPMLPCYRLRTTWTVVRHGTIRTTMYLCLESLIPT